MNTSTTTEQGQQQNQDRSCARSRWTSVLTRLTPQERGIVDSAWSNARLYSGALGVTLAAASFAAASRYGVRSNLAKFGAVAAGGFVGAGIGRATAMRSGLSQIRELPESQRSELTREWELMRFRPDMFRRHGCGHCDHCNGKKTEAAVVEAK
ncbi:hypothetical protein BC828DRAFT_394356 [Blastocladiella britannica]|nr:hypothetical protein BC828DRAFT_394356 [Blastocladiella britannica]